ncbi:MAG: alkaline phosphatase family protein [Flavobacteriaceae bacterium]|nr:alkaline phosphatase family protein [Flavobacteriaceae bacterium]
MKKVALFLLLLITALGVYSQQDQPYQQPKLVVGIVVDQMRYDYLTRFWNDFGDGGFKRLINEGFLSKNHHYNYIPTVTAPGHTSIYTGTTPAVHGILGNNWYDKFAKQRVYCADDTDYPDFGTEGTGGKAPTRLLTTTITDQLRLHYQFNSKVIGVAIKDRGAIFPVGHTANAAYWFEGGSTGNWITSSYYVDRMPDWVNEFNSSSKVEAYKQTWNTLNPIDEYEESGLDSNNYEELFVGENNSGFPHEISKYFKENDEFDVISETPFGNSITTDFSIEAIIQERLGIDEIPDFISISYSSTDKIGHRYGVNSIEVQDTYLRLDLELERLLNFLDKNIGYGEYTLFLTADHAAMHVPSFLKDSKIPAGHIEGSVIAEELFKELESRFGMNIIEAINYNEIYLDREALRELEKKGMTSSQVRQGVAEIMYDIDNIERVYTSDQLRNFGASDSFDRMVFKGYNPKRSGDIFFIQSPGFVDDDPKGSSHSSAMIYDTHVPLIFYGQGIKKGVTSKRTEVTDIAPTLAVLLGIGMPNGTTGTPIEDLLED